MEWFFVSIALPPFLIYYCTYGSIFWTAVLIWLIRFMERNYIGPWRRPPPSPNPPVMYAVEPHGVFPVALNLHFSFFTRVAATSILFEIPLVAGVVRLFGAIPATRDNIVFALLNGEPVALCPSGIRGLLERRVVERTGFLRIAMETGTKVVPVWSHNEWRAFQWWIPFPRVTTWLLTTFWAPFGIFSWPRTFHTRLTEGDPIDPGKFTRVEDFACEFYRVLETLKK